ncbi:hypothetical protein B0T11DRAFT_257351 [Plectosphaerella cucumerina]|uniref:Uncharacterized protein n=1 Tax=Plectosphaerella cucumerina TaxID=40658 RepID=A0A8K0X4U7_9PEZI|nr:hypothetical protein B0T11DRAFT_257351 [Plectosphaerella cucumerina]
MPHDQATTLAADQHAAAGHAVPRPGVAALRCPNMCQSSSGGPAGDMQDAVDDAIWLAIKNMDQARVRLEQSREVAKRENLEKCNALLQQQQDSLNAHWSSCYGELRRDGEETIRELENATVKIQELTARDKAAEVTLCELRQTLDRQNHEAAKARSVTQATEAVLVMKEQRIAELEAIEKDMAGQLEDEKARHAMLEADYAEVVDIASSLTEGPDGTALAEFFDRHRALEQQVRELRAESEAQAEHLRAATASKEQGAENAGDEGRGKRRKRAT